MLNLQHIMLFYYYITINTYTVFNMWLNWAKKLIDIVIVILEHNLTYVPTNSYFT